MTAPWRRNLEEQNLNIFIRMAEGVDDETWTCHLENGDLSERFRSMVQSEDLTDRVRELETDGGSAEETRHAVAEAIRERHTMPEYAGLDFLTFGHPNSDA